LVDVSGGLAAERREDGVRLSWPMVPGSFGYRIFWSDGQGWRPLADVGPHAIAFVHHDAPAGLTYKVAAAFGAFPTPVGEPAAFVESWDASAFADPDAGGGLAFDDGSDGADPSGPRASAHAFVLIATLVVASWGILIAAGRRS
jgi:hypothetical protein